MTGCSSGAFGCSRVERHPLCGLLIATPRVAPRAAGTRVPSTGRSLGGVRFSRSWWPGSSIIRPVRGRWPRPRRWRVCRGRPGGPSGGAGGGYLGRRGAAQPRSALAGGVAGRGWAGSGGGTCRSATLPLCSRRPAAGQLRTRSTGRLVRSTTDGVASWKLCGVAAIWPHPPAKASATTPNVARYIPRSTGITTRITPRRRTLRIRKVGGSNPSKHTSGCARSRPGSLR